MAKIKCPVCGCFESADAEVCRACGASLHDRPQNEDDQKFASKVKCTACGCLESTDAEVCRACGAALQSVPVQGTSFAQAVAGIFSWMEGKGLHGIDKDVPLSNDNIFEDSDISVKPLADFVCIGSIYSKDDSFDAEEDPTIYDPAYSWVIGNIYNTES